MSGEPAEYWARRWMEQGYGTIAIRHLEHQIHEEMTNPMVRCPSCEEPGYPTLISWPERSQGAEQRYDHQRYGLCVLCGYKWKIYHHRAPGGWRFVFNETEADEIVEMYKAGYLIREIAERKYGSLQTIRAVLKRRGIKLKRGSKPFRGLTPEVYENLKFLRGQLGWTYQEVADYMGMWPTTVRKYCIQLGIKRFDVKRIQKEVNMRRYDESQRRIAAKSKVRDGGEPLTPAMAGND